MISQRILQETDLWEVWIEFDPCNPKYFGTLYVIGEICIDTTTADPLIRKIQMRTGTELILQVPSRPVGRSRMKEVLFSEPITNPNSYSSVSVYAGNERIARFDEIEILI